MLPVVCHCVTICMLFFMVGFIIGTLGLAISNVADRFAPSHIFLCASVLGCVANLLFAYQATGLTEGLVYRFVVGISLAGIYDARIIGNFNLIKAFN